jgi:UDP-glucose 4-epimerase
MTWLITGGAGYIGAHVVRAMQAQDIPVVVLDDLSSGHRSFVTESTPFVHGSVVDQVAVHKALADHGCTGAIHLAGFKYAGVSVERPLHTYEQNVTGAQVLLGVMNDLGLRHLVFSSSAAVYGTPDVDLVTEDLPGHPESPYGESKLISEWLIRDVARVSDLRHTSLRYFNVVGSGYPDIFDTSPHNLFPLVLKALSEGRRPVVRGTNYPTPDGSCVRDYVHVADVADAHVAAARAIEDGKSLEPVYNLGGGEGVSVLQIMTAMADVTGIDFTPEIADRRPGDPARIVASGALAARDLDWASRRTLTDCVSSAWEAWKSHELAAPPT